MLPFHSMSFQVLRQHQPLFTSGPSKTWGKSLFVVVFFPSLTLFLSVSASVAFESAVCCSPSPWHSSLAHSPGPPCGMLYSVRPMEQGHPGTQGERTRAHTHMLTHIHADKYSCWEPSQPFGRHPSQRRVVLEERKKEKKVPHFPCMLC